MFSHRFTISALLVFVLVFPIYFIGPKVVQVKNTLDAYDTPRPKSACPRMALVLVSDLMPTDNLSHLVAILEGRDFLVLPSRSADASATLSHAARLSPGGIGLITLAEAGAKALQLKLSDRTTPIRGRWLIMPPLELSVLYSTLGPELPDHQRRAIIAHLSPLLPPQDQQALTDPAIDPTRLSKSGLSLWRLVHGRDPGLTTLLVETLPDDLRATITEMALAPPRTSETLAQTVLIYDHTWRALKAPLRDWLGQKVKIRFAPLSGLATGTVPDMSWQDYMGLFLTLYGLLEARDSTTIAHDQTGHPVCLPPHITPESREPS